MLLCVLCSRVKHILCRRILSRAREHARFTFTLSSGSSLLHSIQHNTQRIVIHRTQTSVQMYSIHCMVDHLSSDDRATSGLRAFRAVCCVRVENTRKAPRQSTESAAAAFFRQSVRMCGVCVCCGGLFAMLLLAACECTTYACCSMYSM